MSKNFELLQQVHKETELLSPSESRRLLHEPIPAHFGTLTHPPVQMSDAEWLRAWATLQRHWRVSAMFAASVMAVVLLGTLLMKPIYAPTASVEIDPPGAELFTMEGRAGGENSAEYLETQSRNMQSADLLIALTREQRLDQNAEFISQSFASRVLSRVLTGIERAPTLIWKNKAASQEAVHGTTLLALTPHEATALQTLQGDLSVKRDTASHLVHVSVATHDPVLSANVTNALVQTFIERTYQTRHQAIMESTEWLSRQLDDIRSKMEQSNQELAAFQRTSGIADVDQNRSTFTEQMGELSRQKTQAQTERIQIESYLRKVRTGEMQSLPQVQSNLVVQQLTQKLGETRAELAQTLAVYGKNHPNAKKLQNQVDELESQIRLQRSAIVGQMETSYAAALTREHMIDGEMRGTAKELGQMAQYTALKKEAEASADLYNTLYARVKEAGIAAASKSANVRMVDPARVLETPTRPKPLMNLGVGLLVALIGGTLLAFGLEALDTRIHTAEDARRSSGVPTVSVLPIAGEDGRATLSASLVSLLGGARKDVGDGPAMFLRDQPESEQSEAIRGIHTVITLAHPEHPPRILLVASSLPGEGKTTVAVNLAMALAQQGTTCLLDADLRRASVAKVFHLGEAAGLSEYLEQHVTLESVLVAAPKVPGLTVITTGKTVADPGKTLNTERARALLRTLGELFDFVVVDSPPILSYVDGRALAPFVDGLVFVGRAGMVTRDAMSRALELLAEIHSAPVVEVVLNGADVKSQPYGYRYTSKYYRQN